MVDSKKRYREVYFDDCKVMAVFFVFWPLFDQNYSQFVVGPIVVCVKPDDIFVWAGNLSCQL